MVGRRIKRNCAVTGMRIGGVGNHYRTIDAGAFADD